MDILVRRQKTLADFALQSEDHGEVLAEACRLIAEALDVQRAKVLEIEEGGRSLLVRAGVGWKPEIVGNMRIPMEEHSSESFSIKAGAPVISRDIHEEDRFEVPDFMKKEGVVALANAPIFLPGKRAYGLLQVDDTRPRFFDEDDTTFLRTYATILGPVIDRLFKVEALQSSEERFRLTVEAATDYAIFVTDAEDRISDWLPGAAAIFGWSVEEAVGRPASMIFTPEDRQAGEPEKELETARREGSAPNVREHLRKDGSRVFIEGTVRALHDTRGRHEGFLKIGQDVSERHEGDRRLRESEERYRSLAALGPALLWQTDETGDEIALNPGWLDYTGQSLEETQDWGWIRTVHPEDRREARRAFAEAYRSGKPLEHQLRLRSRNVDYRWFLIRHTPQVPGPDNVLRWFGAGTDIHEMRELQQRQAVMVAELQHRTRNLLGVVRSLSNQTMARTGPTEAFREQFNDRLEALSRVQGLLSRAEQKPITLGALLQLELEAIGAAESERVMMSGPTIRIRSTFVQTLSLALHELATNSRKHGALSEMAQNSRLTVTWTLHESEGGRRLLVKWRETGLPPRREDETPSKPTGGYGRRLIERALPYSLGAETTFNLEADRLLCTIDLPLDPSKKDKEQ
ncbi:MAG: PAS domain S-box protein [Candidatus Wenzhouxiangella sp. M2_3B_020]